MKYCKFIILIFIIFINFFSSIISCNHLTNDCENKNCSVSKNTWLSRSFGSYVSHDLMQTKSLFISHSSHYDKQLNFSCLFEYMQNFGGTCDHLCKNLGSMPFWSGTNVMTVGNNDGKADLDAYQLGLGNVITNSDGIAGIIQLNPKIQHVAADIMLYYTKDTKESGIFLKLHAPLGAMIVESNFKELMTAHSDNQVSFTQTTLDPNSSLITYQFKEYPTPELRPASISEAFFGGASSLESLNGNRPNHPIRLRKGRMIFQKQTCIRLADLSISCGYNFIKKNGFVGFAAKATCPTGNVPTGDYVLETIFGRAGSWGLGAELTGLYSILLSDKKEKYIDLWIQAELLHLFIGRSPQFRSFDLKQNGPGSKYLLVQNYEQIYKRINAITSGLMKGLNIQPAVNITTLPVHSEIDVEGAVAIMLDYHCKDNWNVGIGCEFWGRSQEKLSIDFRSAINLRLPNLNDYAVLGRQISGYYIDGQNGELQTFYCEPLAKIGKSKDTAQLVGSVPTVTIPATLPDGIKDASDSENRIPEKLEDALDIAGAQASSVCTTKLFGQMGYTWTQHACMPSLSCVGGVEFAGNTDNAISLWSVGIQGSFSF